MPHLQAPQSRPSVPDWRTADGERLQELLAHCRAPSTRLAYNRDWMDFQCWCQERNLPALPTTPELMARYLAVRSEQLALSTLRRRLAAVAAAHQMEGLDLDTRHPLIRNVLMGIARQNGCAPKPKAALTVERVREIVSRLGDTPADRRDRALILVGFAAALRRSELVAIDVEDLAFAAAGIEISVRSTKTNPTATPVIKGIPAGTEPATCTVAAVKKWLITARLDGGPLFRSIDRYGNIGTARLTDKSVALIVKRRVEEAAQAAGASAAEAREQSARFAGHSLRSGFVTSAIRGGAAEATIQHQTGHRRRESLQHYARRVGIFDKELSARIGL